MTVCSNSLAFLFLREEKNGSVSNRYLLFSLFKELFAFLVFVVVVVVFLYCSVFLNLCQAGAF